MEKTIQEKNGEAMTKRLSIRKAPVLFEALKRRRGQVLEPEDILAIMSEVFPEVIEDFLNDEALACHG